MADLSGLTGHITGVAAAVRIARAFLRPALAAGAALESVGVVWCLSGLELSPALLVAHLRVRP